MISKATDADKEAYKAALTVKEYCNEHKGQCEKCVFGRFLGFDCALHDDVPYWQIVPIDHNGMFEE